MVVALTFAATLGQLVALSHEMTVRHFRCAEHGDLTHVASLRFTSTTAEASTVPLRPEGEGPSVDGGGLAGADAHDHCSVALTLRGSAHAPVIRTAVRFSPPPSAVRRPAVVPLQPGRAFVLASAPKTSPPVV